MGNTTTCAHSLIDDVSAVNIDNGDADEEMKVVRLPVGPTALPNGQRLSRRKLPFEAEQKPAMGEEELHRVAKRLQVGVEGGG